MRVVRCCLGTLVEQGGIELILRLIALVELLRSSRHIDELYVELCCQLFHVVRIVHRVVVLRQRETGLQLPIDYGIVLATQVVAGIASYHAICKVTAADGRHQNRCSTFFLDGIDNLLQTLLIRRRGRRASAVALHGGSIRGIALGGVVSLQLQVVHTVVLRVVVGKLNNYVVASLYRVLGVLPQLVVAASRVAAALGVVHAGPAVGKEVTEVHSPAARSRGLLVVRSHRRVAQRVYLLGMQMDVAHQQDGEHSQHQAK